MPDDDQMTLLREEAETLAAFLHLLQREYTQLQADFASVLTAIGKQVEVPTTAHLPHQHIERAEDPTTGAVTFRLVHEG